MNIHAYALLILVGLAYAQDNGDHGEHDHGHDHGDHDHEAHDHSDENFRIATIESEPFYSVVDGEKAGYVIDFIEELQHVMGEFRYSIAESPDGKYGFKEGDRWNGIIGQLVNGAADVAIADLTVTSTRETAVDFSDPFMEFGLSILIKKPSSGELQVKSLADLVNQDTIKYGTVRGGSTDRYIENSQDRTIKNADQWMRMNSDDAYVSSVSEGIRKVRQGNYAFILESPSAEFFAHQEPCDLAELEFPGGNIGEYALAFPKNSRHLSHFNDALASLKENGHLQHLHHTWFHKACDSHSHGHHDGDDHDHDHAHDDSHESAAETTTPGNGAVAVSNLIPLLLSLFIIAIKLM